MLLHNSISFVTDSGLLYFSLADGNLVDHSLDPQCTNIIGSPSRPLGAGSGGWRNGDKPPVPDAGLPLQGRFQALSHPSASCAVGPGGLPKGNENFHGLYRSQPHSRRDSPPGEPAPTRNALPPHWPICIKGSRGGPGRDLQPTHGNLVRGHWGDGH